MSDTPQAGWYPDPSDPSLQRYWDGTKWTEHTAPAAGAADQSSPAAGGGASWPQGGTSAPTGGSAPDTWLWQSIVATLFCCLPAGVVGIIYAAQAQSAIGTGDYATATAKASTARTWTLVSVGLGVVTIIIAVAFGLLGAVVESTNI